MRPVTYGAMRPVTIGEIEYNIGIVKTRRMWVNYDKNTQSLKIPGSVECHGQFVMATSNGGRDAPI